MDLSGVHCYNGYALKKTHSVNIAKNQDFGKRPEPTSLNALCLQK